jgi:hypothetical protein
MIETYDKISGRYKDENGKYAKNEPCEWCGSREGMGHDEFEFSGQGECICPKCYNQGLADGRIKE